MFTVVICGNALIRSMRENHSHLLDLLMRNSEVAICPWNLDAATLEEAVPGLDALTAGKPEWRAVIIQEGETFGYECIDRRNPFDAVGSVKVLHDFGEEEILALMDELAMVQKSKTPQPEEEQRLEGLLAEKIPQSAEKIEQFRALKKNNYLQAPRNPLTRLAIWMLGSPVPEEPEQPESWPAELLGEEAAVDRQYYDRLAACGLLPTELEQLRVCRYKYNALQEWFLSGSLLQKKPAEVLVLAERLGKRAEDIFRTAGTPHEELEYDNFCDDNLYPDPLRFVLCDVEYENRLRTPASYMSFMTFLFMMISHPVPDGALRAHRVYSGEAVLDHAKARRFFTKYLRKLEMTKKLLQGHLRRREKRMDIEEVSEEEAIKLFESDVRIPVTTRADQDRKDFMAAGDIGLAKDCPQDEYDYWYRQMAEITKKFIRYLREPRRALKHAVRYDFKDRSVIEDERILLLSEERLEDIDYHLQEEEQKMVETTTTRLFKTKEYTDRMEKADKKVRATIFRRMTRKKTLITALIALAAFFFGFIPLLVGNLQSVENFTASLSVTGIAIDSLALIGLIFLIVMRAKLKKLIRFFNATMLDIMDDIENGLKAFSRYLSHACNVMREFSIFNFLQRSYDSKANILKKHIHDIQGKIDGINGLYMALDPLEDDGDVQPYNFDFSKAEDYIYEIPYEDLNSSVEFVFQGNEVSAPIDYVKRITIEREELYD
ncbi:MAG: hypothetical protein IJ043_10230 [Clostridia bacterium]|nr:hypothetical protein [Clostridia bacterium]